jgi:hypothetical protein
MAKRSKAKLPKRIAGVKIPKSVRKGPVADFLYSPGGQVAIAEALVIAAGVFASSSDPNSRTGKLLRTPGETLREAGRSTVRAKDAVSRGSRKLSYAFTEAIKSFRSALQDEDIEAALAKDAEVLVERNESAPDVSTAKKKRSSSTEVGVEPRYPSNAGSSSNQSM